MSVDLKGNRAVKIGSDRISEADAIAMKSKKAWIYYNLINLCDQQLQLTASKNDMDSFDYMFAYHNNCVNYEKLFFREIRAGMRKKLYQDQINEFSAGYNGIYHPYNPYMQKFHGAYLRSYQYFG
jgi:hypothetical protein